jgi:hypothetical protein
MCGVDAFVAEDAADFVDAFDAADEESLEVKFKSDPEVEGHIEGVMVGDEGARCGAAGDGMEDGGFDFVEAVAAECLSDGVDDGGAFEHPREDAFGVDEIEVALSDEDFGVFEAVKFFGGLSEGFAEDVEFVNEDGDFAGVGAAEWSIDPDDVAIVEGAEKFPLVFGEVTAGTEQLDGAGLILEVDEAEFASFAAAHDASGGADDFAVGSGFLGAALAEFGDCFVAIEAAAPGIESERLDFLQFFESGEFQSVGFGALVHGISG